VIVQYYSSTPHIAAKTGVVAMLVGYSRLFGRNVLTKDAAAEVGLTKASALKRSV
jgi:hypothetical protein